MASNTSNLNLLKKDPLTDGNDTFNIKTMLNDNWDKIDEFAGKTTPISRGGTGATTAAQALANLGGIATGAVGNLHVWERVQSGVTDYLTSTDRNAYPDKSAEGGEPEKPAYYTLGNEQTNELIQTSGSAASLYFNVASSVSVADDGTVSLVSPSQITLTAQGSTMNLSDFKTSCAGKFIVAKDQTMTSLRLFGIWYVGEDCEFTDVADRSAGTKTLSCSNMQLVTGHAKVEEIPANTTITYLGQLGDGARIEVGTYVGTGTYGKSNPNSLTFGFEPKVVIVQDYEGGFGYPTSVWLYGCKKGLVSTNTVVQAWNGRNLEWYGTSNANIQLNASGYKYNYIAIG